jgi:hypothetical protein
LAAIRQMLLSGQLKQIAAAAIDIGSLEASPACAERLCRPAEYPTHLYRGPLSLAG